MKDLLESGVHFGHQVSKWNPKMKNFIYTKRNGIHIINLQVTIEKANKAYEFVKTEIAKGKKILFVGTKKQNNESIQVNAKRCGAYYITYRWLGGMLTNFNTIKKRLDYFRELEEFENQDAKPLLTKKEISKIHTKKEYLKKVLDGIRDMEKVPEIIFIVDILKDHIAVKEARKLNIPIVSLVDSNTNPELVDYPIPANDDAIRSTSLFLKFISDAILEGKELLKSNSEQVLEESEGENESQDESVSEGEGESVSQDKSENMDSLTSDSGKINENERKI